MCRILVAKEQAGTMCAELEPPVGQHKLVDVGWSGQGNGQEMLSRRNFQKNE